MNDREFKAEIKKGLSGAYLLYGDEEYLKEHYIKEAKKTVLGEDSSFSAFNLIEKDEMNYSSEELAYAVSSLPVMNDKLLVIAKIKLSKLGEKDRNRLYEILSSLKDFPSTVLLIVVGKGQMDVSQIKKNRPLELYKKLTEYAVPVEFSYQSPSVLKKWIMRHFEKDSLGADDATLGEIINVVGTDMTILSIELEKLICYAKAKEMTEITANIVKLLCCDNGELDAFALSNAVVSGNKAQALDALKECKYKKQKATFVLAKISADFANMLKVSLLLKSGMYKKEIAESLGIHPYKAGLYIDAVANSEPERIRAALARCHEADRALKSTRLDYTALERLICTMPSNARRKG